MGKATQTRDWQVVRMLGAEAGRVLVGHPVPRVRNAIADALEEAGVDVMVTASPSEMLRLAQFAYDEVQDELSLDCVVGTAGPDAEDWADALHAIRDIAWGMPIVLVVDDKEDAADAEFALSASGTFENDAAGAELIDLVMTLIPAED